MIYFIQNESNRAIKIGFTGEDVPSRMAQLQTASPDRLKLLGSIPGTTEDECFLHEMLDSYRMSGEWFRPHRDVISWIEWLSSWAARQSVQPSRPLAIISEDAEVSTPEEKTTRFICGMRVHHPEYGSGKFVEWLTGGRGKIAFDNGEIKYFIVNRSPLKACS